MDYQFQSNSKFGMLAVNNVYTDLPEIAFQLSDGTWVMPGVPVSDLGIWKEWIGSIRMERLGRANLVLFTEEPSANPEILDAVHHRLDKDLSLIFYLAAPAARRRDRRGRGFVMRLFRERRSRHPPDEPDASLPPEQGMDACPHHRCLARRQSRSARGRHGDGRRQNSVPARHSRPQYPF